MADLLNVLLLGLPIAFAGLAGRWLADYRLSGVSVLGLAVVALYPFGHWYILHYGFGLNADPSDKDQMVGASITWLVMVAEVPVCLIVYLIVRSICGNANGYDR